jgi:hypothetical protein
MNIDDIFGHMLAYKMPLTQHQPSSDFLMSSTNLTAHFPGRRRKGWFSFLGHGDQLANLPAMDNPLMEEVMFAPLKVGVMEIISLGDLESLPIMQQERPY